MAPGVAYHAAHLARCDVADRLLNVASLGGTVVLAVVLCLVPVRAQRST